MLARLLSQAPQHDPRLLVGPGVGLDCAVIENGDNLLVLKSDPITFATEAIGWYAVQVNANDIATCGATPRWMTATLLLPENQTTPELVERIAAQLFSACEEIGVSLAGGHTEITYGLDRPILVGAMIGEVARHDLVTPRGAQAGDCLLLSKGAPIEATAILAYEMPERLQAVLSQGEMEAARHFLHDPGISVLADARAALQAGRVHAMHDPTEGGIYTAAWELAEASGCDLLIDPQAAPVFPLSRKICAYVGIDPLGAIASGALLMAVAPQDATAICSALAARQIACTQIGSVLEKQQSPTAWQKQGPARLPLPRPERDEIARLLGEPKIPHGETK
jgi:hydrogenase maturation factor